MVFGCDFLYAVLGIILERMGAAIMLSSSRIWVSLWRESTGISCLN